jgi:uncharacterized protein HemX
MITKEEIKKEVDKLPSSLLEEVYSFLKKVSQRAKGGVTEDKNSKKWEEWWSNLQKFSPDFMNDRTQPKTQSRDNIFN